MAGAILAMAIGATMGMATGHFIGVATGPIIGVAITAIRTGIMADHAIMGAQDIIADRDIMTGHIVTTTAKARSRPIELRSACALIRLQRSHNTTPFCWTRKPGVAPPARRAGLNPEQSSPWVKHACR